jgi:hypothetical protein
MQRPAAVMLQAFLMSFIKLAKGLKEKRTKKRLPHSSSNFANVFQIFSSFGGDRGGLALIFQTSYPVHLF